MEICVPRVLGEKTHSRMKDKCGHGFGYGVELLQCREGAQRDAER